MISQSNPMEIDPPQQTSPQPKMNGNGSQIEEKKDKRKVLFTKGKIEDFYTFGEDLGFGAFSIVRKATSKVTNAEVAVKQLRKSQLTAAEKNFFLREITNMHGLDHPNIVSMLQSFEDEENFYLVMELVRGKELFQRIIEKGKYTEQDARVIVFQIVEALNYLHQAGIAHRDMKPENILSVIKDNVEIIKVADFGFSKNFKESSMKTACGSLGYAAPEILEGHPYDNSCDMWSLGVITYVLLSGCHPFYPRKNATQAEVAIKILNADYRFGSSWAKISEEGKAFVSKLLVKDSKSRYTAANCKLDPWLNLKPSQVPSQEPQTLSDSMHLLKKYIKGDKV